MQLREHVYWGFTGCEMCRRLLLIYWVLLRKSAGCRWLLDFYWGFTGCEMCIAVVAYSLGVITEEYRV